MDSSCSARQYNFWNRNSLWPLSGNRISHFITEMSFQWSTCRKNNVINLASYLPLNQPNKHRSWDKTLFDIAGRPDSIWLQSVLYVKSVEGLNQYLRFTVGLQTWPSSSSWRQLLASLHLPWFHPSSHHSYRALLYHLQMAKTGYSSALLLWQPRLDLD